MQTILTKDLELELQAIDPRVVIAPNQNRPGAANVLLNGVDICTWVPMGQVQYEKTPDYQYTLPNDMVVPFKTVDEIKEIVTNVINKIKSDKEEAEAVFDNSYLKDEESKNYGVHTA